MATNAQVLNQKNKITVERNPKPPRYLGFHLLNLAVNQIPQTESNLRYHVPPSGCYRGPRPQTAYQ
eukprot:1378092-Amorphochlora_amoeboformis.AAC.1